MKMVNWMNFDNELKSRVEHIEKIIAEFLPEEKGWQKSVIEAMNYSVLAGGKRLRPMLMEETYRFFGGTRDVVKPFMAAIEMIHTYSLVHDDLPAMDNDEYRRGRKTTHVVYGEAMAILAVDGLLNYAFETAVKAFEMVDPKDILAVSKALSILARKAGIYGMIGGQTADIEAENISDSREDEALKNHPWEEHLLFIHEHKTAALIQASMMIGAVLAGATESQLEVVEKAAYDIGVAFQIQDDILDITSTFEELGKPIGSDEKNNKMTYVSLKGIDQATQDQKIMSNRAIQNLEQLGNSNGISNEFLMELIKSLITRIK